MKTEDDLNWNPEGKPCDICKQNPWTHQLMIGEYRYDLRHFWTDADLFLNLCLGCEVEIIRQIRLGAIRVALRNAGVVDVKK